MYNNRYGIRGGSGGTVEGDVMCPHCGKDMTVSVYLETDDDGGECVPLFQEVVECECECPLTKEEEESIADEVNEDYIYRLSDRY